MNIQTENSTIPFFTNFISLSRLAFLNTLEKSSLQNSPPFPPFPLRRTERPILLGRKMENFEGRVRINRGA